MNIFANLVAHILANQGEKSSASPELPRYSSNVSAKAGILVISRKINIEMILIGFPLPASVFYTEYKLRSSIGINVPYTILIWRHEVIKS